MPRDTDPQWAHLSDEELLDLRFRDLGLELEGSRLEAPIEQLYEELALKGLRFRPHCWLSEEWFCPDGVPGIAIPFYLAHRRLMQLERRQVFQVEGGSSDWCRRILRHEAGHAIDNAFRLQRRKRWQQVFGRPNKPYPDHYRPTTYSKKFVLHLGWWYAQAHPTEDFAETFAVWLRPGQRWRRAYEGWPAKKKLEYVDELMMSLENRAPPVRTRRQVEPLRTNSKTLRQHYEEKRELYLADYPEVYDRDLRTIFHEPGPQNEKTKERPRPKRKTAASFLERHRVQLRDLVSRGTGEHPYTVDQVLDEMVVRCRELGLRLEGQESRVLVSVAILMSVQLINYLHSGRHKVPL